MHFMLIMYDILCFRHFLPYNVLCQFCGRKSKKCPAGKACAEGSDDSHATTYRRICRPNAQAQEKLCELPFHLDILCGHMILKTMSLSTILQLPKKCISDYKMIGGI